MPRRKREPAIDKTVMAEYQDKLASMSLDSVQNLVFNLEDNLSSDDPIKQSHIPKVIPEPVRVQLVELSSQQMAIRQQIEDVLDDLYEMAELVQNTLEKEAEAAKPHCKECGQVLKEKRTRRR